MNLPLALKTDVNIVIFHCVVDFLQNLTLKLGCINTIPFSFHMIRYMHGNGLGKHGDYLRARKIVKEGISYVACIEHG